MHLRRCIALNDSTGKLAGVGSLIVLVFFLKSTTSNLYLFRDLSGK